MLSPCLDVSCACPSLSLSTQGASIESLIGPATRIPFIAGSDFTDVFPLFIVGFALVTLLNLIPLLMKCLRISKYTRGATRHDDETDVRMQEGTLLILKEKRARGVTGGGGGGAADGKRPALARPGTVFNPNARTLNGQTVVPASVRLAAANAAKAPPAPPRYTSASTSTLAPTNPTFSRAHTTPTPPITRSRSASPSPSPSPTPSRAARPPAPARAAPTRKQRVTYDEVNFDDMDDT